MNRKRIGVLATVLAISPLLVMVPSVLADVTQVSTPISFTLSGCTSLPAGLTVKGTGESFLVINSRTDKNGNTYIERNDLVTGTATDSNGATYVFNYFQHASSQVPPGGFPISADVTDHFNLVGDGQANQLQVHFVARVTILSPTTFIFEFINMHGNPMFCDPI